MDGPLIGQPLIFHRSAKTVFGSDHLLPSNRTVVMSRISSLVRPRYTIRIPFAVRLATGWQHSQTRPSMIVSGPSLPSTLTVVYISATSSVFFGPSSFRLSSQTTPRSPPGLATRDTKPCSVLAWSRLGATGLLHVLPSSRENDSLMPYASSASGMLLSQCAASRPLPIGSMDGKSA